MSQIMTLAEMRARYPRTAVRAAREIGPARHDAATTIRIRDLAAQAQQAAVMPPEPEPVVGGAGERLAELIASTPDEDCGWR